MLNLTDIGGGISVFREYNCDTVITVGGLEDIECGKFVAALAANDGKTAQDLCGVGNIKRDMTVLCCIVTDNSYAATSSFAEYYDDMTGNRRISASSYLIPQMVVIDTDFLMRTKMDEAVDSALMSLGLAFESFSSPYGVFAPEYRANAEDACLGIISGFSKMVNNPSDSYARKLVATGGFYSGLSSRLMGLGYGKFIINALFEKQKTYSGAIYLKTVAALIRLFPVLYLQKAAAVAKKAHICTASTMDPDAAEVFANYIEKISSPYLKASTAGIDPKDVQKTAEDIRRNAQLFGYDRLSVSDITKVLTALNVNEK